MRKAASILILCASTLSLSACAIRNTSPCVGFGCPALATKAQEPATPQHAQAQKPGDTKQSVIARVIERFERQGQ